MTPRLLVVTDKLYARSGAGVSCAVNYNELFRPLRDRFAIAVLGRELTEPRALPFPVEGVRLHGIPYFRSYADFVRRYRLGADGRRAGAVIERAVASSDIVFMAVGCHIAREVEAACRRHRRPLVVEVLDDVVGAVATTAKYRWPLRGLALWAARRQERFYRGLCARHPSLFLGRELFRRYAPVRPLRPRLEFFESLMDAQDLRFAPRMRGPEGPHLLFVGRLVAMKSVQTLIAACAELARDGQPFRCRIVGEGECEPALRAATDRAGLGERIEFLGFRRFGPELFALYDWADYVVLPSTGGEGVPRVLLEAMGRGCLPIASAVCGIPSIVHDGVNGCLVPPRRPDAIAGVVRTLEADAPRRERLLAGARVFAEAHVRERQAQTLGDFIAAAARGAA